MWSVIKKNPISSFAVLCVAASAGFLCYMAIWLTTVLSSSEWCAKAIQAEKITPGNTFVGLTSCVELLKIQLQAISMNSQIVVGSFALCLLVLVVIVVAGAKAAGRLPGGIEFDVSRQEAAEHVVHGAQNAAREVSDTIEVPGSDVIS